MNKQNQNYEKIRAACIKANPRLMELSFGCRVVLEHRPFEAIEKVEGIILEKHDCVNKEIAYRMYFPSIVEPFQKVVLIKEEAIKTPLILGHPVQLSDVLMAVKSNTPIEYAITSDNSIIQISLSGDETLSEYDLSKPLKDQSPETLSFIASLL